MELKDYRVMMDSIDSEILSLFIRRMELSADIGAYKKERSLPVCDERREREKLEAIAAQCPEALQSYALDLYENLFRLSREYQTRLRGGTENA